MLRWKLWLDDGQGAREPYLRFGELPLLHHGASMPELAPGLFVNLGPLALSYVLAAGGSGYFRMSAVEPHIAAGQLRLVPEMPQFSYPIYGVYATGSNDAVLGPALAGLRAIATAPPDDLR